MADKAPFPGRFEKFFSDIGPVRIVNRFDLVGKLPELLGLGTDERLEQSRRLFMAHQFRILAEAGGLPDELISQMCSEHGYDIREYPIDSKTLLPRWTTDYLIDNVFWPFLQFGDQLRFSSEYYERRIKNQRIPEDDSIDEFLARGITYRPQQIAFFNQGLENDTFYLASDLRLGDLNPLQRKELLDKVNEYITALIYSEICYSGFYNPFYEGINRLLRAAAILDSGFSHPFVGVSKVHYSEGDKYEFPSGYWAQNPIPNKDSVFLGNSGFEHCRDLLPNGVKAKIIGGRGLGTAYYCIGELVEILE